MTEETEGFERRFASLDEASRTLSVDVAALNDTLVVVAALQKEQQAQKLRQAETEARVTQGLQRARARERRNRTAIFASALGLAILLPLVSILVYASLITHVNRLLHEQDVVRYQSCQARNEATMDNSTREAKLAALERNPTAREIHLDSSRNLKATIRGCVPPKDR